MIYLNLLALIKVIYSIYLTIVITRKFDRGYLSLDFIDKTTDLIPEIKKEISVGKSTITLAIFLVGIFLMWLTKTIEI